MTEKLFTGALGKNETKLPGSFFDFHQIPMLRRPSFVRSHFSKIFSSETTWPINAKFHEEPPWVGGGGGAIVCINGIGHLTKMAAIPIYGKNLLKSSSPERAVLCP